MNVLYNKRIKQCCLYASKIKNITITAGKAIFLKLWNAASVEHKDDQGQYAICKDSFKNDKKPSMIICIRALSI